MKPYIGVTGFMRQEEVRSALAAFPEHPNRVLMVGVLASWKSLRGVLWTQINARWRKRFPNPAAIGELFLDNPRALNLVHYSAGGNPEEFDLLKELLKIHELAGPNLHGFQLNIAWPETRTLENYRHAMGWHHHLILQIGKRAVELAGGTPEDVAGRLSDFAGVIDGVLFDMSGGDGKAIDAALASEFLSAIESGGWALALGAAGGFGPESVSAAEPIVRRFPGLNIDAEGKLRDGEENLDLNAVKTYLAKAAEIFS